MTEPAMTDQHTALLADYELALEQSVRSADPDLTPKAAEQRRQAALGVARTAARRRPPPAAPPTKPAAPKAAATATSQPPSSSPCNTATGRPPAGPATSPPEPPMHTDDTGLRAATNNLTLRRGGEA